MKQLIIVESPSKAIAIQKYLGGDAVVMASNGHVCDLPTHTLGIDVDAGFKPQYVISPDKKELIEKLSQAITKYDIVYLATDPDREGEAISWHLKNSLGIKEDKVRITFNEISPKAVRAAMNQPREIDMRLVDSQQARRILDRLVGYKISPILARKLATSGNKTGMSAGRVQSAALKMIVDRENEIRVFTPEEYWKIFALLYKENSKRVKTNLIKAAFNDFGCEKVKIGNTDDASALVERMKNAHYIVDEVKKSVSTTKPAPPFTTSTLQQEANHKLNMSSDRAMRVAQRLYEGVEIAGEGLNALVTYIRTDSVRVSPDFAAASLEFIKANYGAPYAPSTPNVYKTSASAQDAHEAIRPISLERTPQSLEGKIEKDQYRLYKLIYERYLASQMKPAIYNTMKVHITGEDSEGRMGFVVRGKSIKFKGFTAVYAVTSESKEDDDLELDTMPDLCQGEHLDFGDVSSEQKFTKPPARYTDASLVKAMEENGIGRPSTYASIISVLAKRGHTEREGKSIKPTQRGEIVCEYLEKNFPDIMSLDFTARLERALDKIADGGQSWQELIGAFYPRLQRFITRALKGVAEHKLPAEVSDVVCDKCGAQMIIKEGRYGKFLACPNYPECKNIKKYVEVVCKCPKCGGNVVKKKTRTGKTFYGCENYTVCDFKSWELPAPKLCPECGGVMKSSTKAGATTYLCTNKECKHREKVDLAAVSNE